MRHRIGTRLMAGFATVFLVMLAAGAVGLSAMRAAQARYQVLSERLLPARAQVAALSVQMYQMSTSLEGFVVFDDAAYLKSYDKARLQAAQVVGRWPGAAASWERWRAFCLGWD